MVKVHLVGCNRFANLDGPVFVKGKTYMVKPDEAKALLSVEVNGKKVFAEGAAGGSEESQAETPKKAGGKKGDSGEAVEV